MSYRTGLPPHQNNPHVYQVLRDCADSPLIECDSGEILTRVRHGEDKPVIVVCTKMYLYLFKRKHMKLYGRWPLRRIEVETSGPNLVILLDTELAQQQYELDPPKESEIEEGAFKDRGRIQLLASSNGELEDLYDQIQTLIKEARDTKTKEESVPDPVRKAKSEQKHDAADDSSDSSSDDEAAGLRQGGKRGFNSASNPKQNAVGEFNSAMGLTNITDDPQRYVMISSLVDGEFADYGVVKQAYLQAQQDAESGKSTDEGWVDPVTELITDLESFTSDNQKQMQMLCHRYYKRFLQAGSQCAQIKEQEVSDLQAALQKSTSAVMGTAVKLRDAGSELEASRYVESQLNQSKTFAQRVLKPLQLMQTAEQQYERRQLLNAITTIQLVRETATPLVESPLGQYLLFDRVPQLHQRIVAQSLQQLNLWCKVLRTEAEVIGKAAMNQRAIIFSVSNVTKAIEVTADGKGWRIRIDTQKQIASDADGRDAMTQVVEQLSNVSRGAGLQDLLTRCQHGDTFLRNVQTSRDRQLQLEIEDKNVEFEKFCHKVLGFMVVEDVCYHVTSPSVTTESRLHTQWSRIISEVGARALQKSSEPADVVKKTLLIARQFVDSATENVRAVELNPSALLAAVDKLRSVLHTDLLQTLSEKVTQISLSDTFDPLPVGNEIDFLQNCTRLHLHRAPHLVRAPSSFTVTVPGQRLSYSLMVPTLAYALIDFVEECYNVVKSNGKSELNNIDPMVLGFLTILTRTVAQMTNMRLQSLGESSIIQAAVLSSNMNALVVALSSVEQKYVTNWEGNLPGDQKFGEPVLLESSAKEMRQVSQQAVSRCTDGVCKEIQDRLAPGKEPKHWANLSEVDSSCLGQTADYLCTLLPQLALIFTNTMIHSLASVALLQVAEHITNNLERAIKLSETRDPPLLHKALDNFERKAQMNISGLAGRLGELISAAGREKGSAADPLPTLRLPLELTELCKEYRSWIDNVYVPRVEEEKMLLQQVAATFEQAGTKMVTGVADVGRATKKGFFTIGRAVGNVTGLVSDKDKAKPK